MGEVMDLLERRGYRLSEIDLAEAIGAILPDRVDAQIALSKTDEAYLAHYSGASPATAEQTEAHAMRRIASATTEVAQALTHTAVAELLRISTSRVSHRQTSGQLYTFTAGPRRKLFPDWQFDGTSVLPHLPDVVAALDPGAPPPLVRRFMLTADPDLDLDGAAMSPRQWLLAGADPGPVIEAAATLGDQP